MHIIVNPQQMRALEARAFSLGVPSLLLMEDAARAAQQVVAQELHGVKGKDILYCAEWATTAETAWPWRGCA